MDPNSTIIERIKTLEPENAAEIIEYFLLQDIAYNDLIRMAFAPNAHIEEFCRKAKSDLGLQLPGGSTLNPNARPFNKASSSSSTRNEFLVFPRNPNIPAPFPSLLRDNPNFNSSLFRDGSSQQQQQLGFSANDAYQFLPSGLVDGFGSLGGFGSPTQQSMIGGQFMGDFRSQMSNRQGSGPFGVQGGFVSPSEQQRMIAAQSVADFGSQMSNRQGSGQFGVERGFRSPIGQQSMIAGQLMGGFGSPTSNRQGSREYGVEGGFVSPSEQQRMIAAQSVADFGSQMSNRQGSGQFGVERGFRSPSGQQSMIAGQLMGGFDSPMSNRQGSREYGVEGGFVSPSEQQIWSRMIAAQSVADFGSQMSNRQGSGQFGVERGFRSPSEQQSLIAGQLMGGFGSPMSNSPGSHQREDLVSKKIFLTFPRGSSFTDEDVSIYFSKFGEVAAVNIPNPQQRKFGFVTFANDETVRTILARENPHIIRGSYVTVKPYKEKEEREQQQQQTFHEWSLENSLIESPKQSTETPQTKSDTEQDKEA